MLHPAFRPASPPVPYSIHPLPAHSCPHPLRPIPTTKNDIAVYGNVPRNTGAALATCLQNSDCVLIERNKPADCLRAPLYDTLPTQCQQLKRGYGQCKRGLLDMRKRFRGNYPVGVSAELEGSGIKPAGGQLYAGGPVAKIPGETDGRGDQKAAKDGAERE